MANREYFRLQRSIGLKRFVWDQIAALFMLGGLLAVIGASYIAFLQGQAHMFFVAAGSTVLFVIFAVGAVSSSFYSPPGSTTTFVLAGNTLSWSTPTIAKQMLCAHIARITIDTTKDWDKVYVLMSDGMTETAPNECVYLLDVSALAMALHVTFPEILVVINGLPACECCGRRTKVTIRDGPRFRSPELQKLTTHYFCKQHRRRAMPHRMDITLAPAVFSAIKQCQMPSPEVGALPMISIPFTGLFVAEKAPKNAFTAHDVQQWAQCLFGKNYLQGFEDAYGAGQRCDAEQRYEEGYQDGLEWREREPKRGTA
jgi:hypothetical protein